MSNKYSILLKDLRLKKGLTQKELAKKLGISRPSYIAIEQGKRDITLNEFEKLSGVLSVSFDDFERGELPDYEKYKQMILTFLRMSDGITKTKLAKLVYLSDFAWFYFNLKSMSGMPYRKIQYGPVPDAYFRAIDELENSGKILINCKQKDDKEMFIISESESNKNQKLDSILKDEVDLMKNIFKKWKNKKTAEIVNFTHNQLPYLIAEDEEIISYGLITQENPDEIY
ncbi:MAG: helix-turn-helix domain-containing protein [Patescibacteria group bacterium]